MAKFILTVEDVTEDNILSMKENFPEAVLGGCIPDWEFTLSHTEQVEADSGQLSAAMTLGNWVIHALNKLYMEAAVLQKQNGKLH